MDLLGLLGGGPETEEVEEEKPKPEKAPKPMSKKKLKELQDKLEAEERERLIREKEELLVSTKERVKIEWTAVVERATGLHVENTARTKGLRETFDRLYDTLAKWNVYKKALREEAEWQRYLKCDRLPNPASVPEMNSYIFFWNNTCKTIEDAIKKTWEVLELLASLNDLVRHSPSETPVSQIEEWKKIRNAVRALHEDKLDRLTYNLLRHTETELEPIDLTTVRFVTVGQHLTLFIWAELSMPSSAAQSKQSTKYLTVELPETEVTITLPPRFERTRKAIRALWMHYDHWSDRCRSFNPPLPPQYHSHDLLQLTREDYGRKQELLEVWEAEKKKTRQRVRRLPETATISQELLAWWQEPQKKMSVVMEEENVQIELKWKEANKMCMDDHEINLRTHTFYGSLLKVNVIHIPSQPKYLRQKHDVTVFYHPQALRHVKYHVKYPPDPKGAEAEKTDAVILEPFTWSDEELEKALKELIVITVAVPMKFIWFQDPKIANWNPDKGYWSSEDIHEAKYNEEAKTLTFHAGRVGLFGFYSTRFNLLPYKNWDIFPDGAGGVTFVLDTRILSLHFCIKYDKVCLLEMEGLPTKAADHLLGVFYLPVELHKLLRKIGVDIFPAIDTWIYLEELKLFPKNTVIEDHVYMVMGVMSQCFKFRSSKHNHAATQRNIIMQAKEFHDQGHENYCDLYALLAGECSSEARRTMETTCFVLAQTVRTFLSYVRPFSYTE